MKTNKHFEEWWQALSSGQQKWAIKMAMTQLSQRGLEARQKKYGSAGIRAILTKASREYWAKKQK